MVMNYLHDVIKKKIKIGIPFLWQNENGAKLSTALSNIKSELVLP